MAGILFLGWILLAALGLTIMLAKGRTSCGLIILILLIPIVGLVVAVVISPDPEREKAKALRKGDAVECPACFSLIDPRASVCPNCRAEITTGLDMRGNKIRQANIPS
ncbi:hypothetical protein GCM10007973_18150 [Polymorphobacter multimanifer]|uniref:Zinc ribbon domain-containing protein n=1 Tax=Polymorphobacter multimanifer TaxID=1070431 RepID=A0A841L5X3_9SPHN|nr:hypothetical protein [Polymorphobacter multimanifer]MBB6228329.1 hypothetical protein [Polymorphobacter multimanifer]GGI82089.1 hypothetical protein GCM10007973_18150 [Polymorphobacter multimanifer]